MNRISSSKIIAALQEMFTRHGLPKTMVSDNGRQFVTKETKEFLASFGIRHVTAPLYSPRQNGLVERFNRVLSEKLDEGLREGKRVDLILQDTLFYYRSTPHCTTGVSPYEAMYGRKMRTKLSSLRPEGKERRVKVCPAEVRRKQKKIADNFNSKFRAKRVPVQMGEKVRIKLPDGSISPLRCITKLGKTSVVTADGKHWALDRVWLPRDRWRSV